MAIEILIGPGGNAAGLYDEAFDFASLGHVQIRRAGFVEPDHQSRWWADLARAGGAKLGPFPTRSTALAAEVAWLSTHAVLAQSQNEGDSHEAKRGGVDRCGSGALLRQQLRSWVRSLRRAAAAAAGITAGAKGDDA
jgi:hypothetical protein